MSLDPPTYLSSLQDNIRARPIPWDGAVRAGHITDIDLKKIKSVDKVRRDQRKQTVEANLDDYNQLLLGGKNTKSVLERAGKRVDVVQYILVLAGDMIDDIPALTSTLLAHPDPYSPFLPLLGQSPNLEDPIPLLTSSVLTSLMSSALLASTKPNNLTSETAKALPKLYSYLSGLAKSSDSGRQDIAVQAYSTLLRTKKARELFWDQKAETVTPLIEILRAAAGVGNNGETSTLWSGTASFRNVTEVGLGGQVGLQLLYHVLLALWQLSFEGALVGDGLEQEHEIVPLLIQLLRLSPKEKTTRLLVSTLVNLISANQSSLLPAAALARLPSLLETLSGRHLTDPDLSEDLATLKEMLEEYTKTRTTFDQYAAEIRTGHLHWSPPHRNPNFWHENARRILDENQGELPKKLAEVMGKSWEGDKQVLAIACNDVGCLVKAVPEKRDYLEKLGLKARVMALMGESDEAVRWESLKAVGEWLRYSFEG
ncbi:MAG: H(+)-transporting V1 sector ATPase subunit H [Trichoglossum hirsutum]|nr:MAG: H(+)-transporting V1 sector ATPase subunit H [Trichoglossum hirsutum]